MVREHSNNLRNLTSSQLSRILHSDRFDSVAQWIERLPPEQKVARSSRAGVAKKTVTSNAHHGFTFLGFRAVYR